MLDTKNGPLLPSGRAQAFLAQAGHEMSVLGLNQADTTERMRREVLEGLKASPRAIPPTYFYDRTGSEIYEEITGLAAYYPTRTESQLLRQAAPWLRRRLRPQQLVELGSGAASKTRLLLAAFEAHLRPLTYVPIDVNAGMLEASANRLMAEFPHLRLLGLASRYDDAFPVFEPHAERLVAFLGGTIGNFAPEAQAAFFEGLKSMLAPGGHLLIGFDRRPHARKSIQTIERAYNDREGLTARFNLNMLAHLNRALKSDFDLGAWAHRAHYNVDADQIEMHLESLAEQQVRFAGGESFRFKPGERILTEISRKYDPEEFAAEAAGHGFHPVEHWSDPQEYFSLMLLVRD